MAGSTSRADLPNVTSHDTLLGLTDGESPTPTRISVESTPEMVHMVSPADVKPTAEGVTLVDVLRPEIAQSKRVTNPKSGKGLTSKSQRFTAGGDEKLIGPLEWSHKFCGGIRADFQRRAPFYLSDWTDGIKKENIGKTLSSSLFLFFACLAPALTFGLLFEDYTEKQLGVVEMILSSGIGGIGYSIFAGQPLCILGATGPELAYTLVFFGWCKQLGLEFLPARVWQGLWTALFTILLSVFDCSALMKHVTRFTEEIFSMFISLIFIIEACINVFNFYHLDHPCDEQATFLLVLMLAFLTFALATACKKQRAGTWATKGVRNFLGDYGVSLSIVIVSAVSLCFKSISVDKLDVPTTIRPTYEIDGKPRPWLVPAFGTDGSFPVWGIFFTALPALGLTFLGFMDQNLTSLLINRRDHRLKKPPAYHIDLLYCGAFIYPVCGFLGLPFTHAATVRSMTHLISLTTRETVSLPGGGSTSRVSSVVEQRVTQLLIHVLLLLSLVLSPILKYVPKAVLYGVFGYMGVSSLAGNQLWDRFLLFFIWDTNNYPRYPYVEAVKLKPLHIFTAIEASCLVILYALSKSPASVAFPFFIGLLVYVRKGMACGPFKKIWSPEDLAALDG